ncbi:MAG: hypothetical protein HYW78_04785, partial [Parcubacteria group bacterium]|nr:hypothetical protein [Parcubacteria group bacterium]
KIEGEKIISESEKKEKIAEGLQFVPLEKLQELNKELQILSKSLADLNSAFPETKAFLKAKGKTNVRQLTAKEKAELLEHLRKVFLKVAN